MRPVDSASFVQGALDKVAGLVEPQFVSNRLGSFKVLDQFGFEGHSAIGIAHCSTCMGTRSTETPGTAPSTMTSVAPGALVFDGQLKPPAPSRTAARPTMNRQL